MTNRAAADIVNLLDQALLWEFVQRLIDDRQVSELTLTNGMPVTVRFESVTDGAEFIGATIRFNATRSAEEIVN